MSDRHDDNLITIDSEEDDARKPLERRPAIGPIGSPEWMSERRADLAGPPPRRDRATRGTLPPLPW